MHAYTHLIVTRTFFRPIKIECVYWPVKNLMTKKKKQKTKFKSSLNAANGFLTFEIFVVFFLLILLGHRNTLNVLRDNICLVLFSFFFFCLCYFVLLQFIFYHRRPFTFAYGQVSFNCVMILFANLFMEIKIEGACSPILQTKTTVEF